LHFLNADENFHDLKQQQHVEKFTNSKMLFFLIYDKK